MRSHESRDGGEPGTELTTGPRTGDRPAARRSRKKLLAFAAIPFVLLILPLILGEVLAGSSSTRILAVDLRQHRPAAQIAEALNRYDTPRPGAVFVIDGSTAKPPCAAAATDASPPAYCQTLDGLSTKPVWVSADTGTAPQALIHNVYGASAQTVAQPGTDLYMGSIRGPSGFSLTAALLTALLLTAALAVIGFLLLGRANRFPEPAVAGPGRVDPGVADRVPPGQAGTGQTGGRRYRRPPGNNQELPYPPAERRPADGPVAPPSPPPQPRPETVPSPYDSRPPAGAPGLGERIRRLTGARARARSPIDQSGGYAEVDGLIMWAVPAGPAAAPGVFFPGDELYVVTVDDANACLTVASRQQEF